MVNAGHLLIVPTDPLSIPSDLAQFFWVPVALVTTSRDPLSSARRSGISSPGFLPRGQCGLPFLLEWRSY